MNQWNVTWKHLLAFVLAVVPIVSRPLADALTHGVAINGSWLLALLTSTGGVGGAIWLAFQQTILQPKDDGRGGLGRSLPRSEIPVGGPVSMKLPPPRNERRILDLGRAFRQATALFACVSLLSMPIVGFGACTTAQVQAVFPELDKVEATIQQDLTAGKTPTQIEEDVAQIFAGQVGVDVVKIVNAAVTLLIDAGVLPAGVIPQAHTLQASMQAKLAARGAQP